MIYEQLNLEDTYLVCVTVARFLGEPKSRKTHKDLEKVWRRLAISSFEIPLLSQESGERGGIREPVVIVRAHQLCARMRGVLVIRDEWDVSCWQHVRNYVFFKAS